jgi:hypothetical protein
VPPVTTCPTTTSTTIDSNAIFIYSNFNCDSTSKTCGTNYNNPIGENVVVVFYLIKNQKTVQKIAYMVSQGSSSFTAPPFSCNSFIQSGQYNIMFAVFRASDTFYKNPIRFTSELKTITLT